MNNVHILIHHPAFLFFLFDYIYTSSSIYIGDVGKNTSQPYFDIHSPFNYVTSAQASAVFEVVDPLSKQVQFVWLGNQWTSSTARNTDLLYWSILEWENRKTI